jgi:hypothetical protein
MPLKILAGLFCQFINGKHGSDRLLRLSAAARG